MALYNHGRALGAVFAGSSIHGKGARKERVVDRWGAGNIQCMARINHGGRWTQRHDMMFVRGGRPLLVSTTFFLLQDNACLSTCCTLLLTRLPNVRKRNFNFLMLPLDDDFLCKVIIKQPFHRPGSAP